MKKKFITARGHIWFNFCNGITLSVFNGCGSHTENWFNHDINCEYFDSDEVEVAILKDDEFITKKFYKNIDDDVITINICQFINLIKKVNTFAINSLK